MSDRGHGVRATFIFTHSGSSTGPNGWLISHNGLRRILEKSDIQREEGRETGLCCRAMQSQVHESTFRPCGSRGCTR